MFQDRKTFFIWLSILLILQSVLTVQGQISGKIINKATGQPIPDANITVLNSRLGAVSKDGGFYFLDNLPDGSHQIQVSVIGYGTVIKSVSIPGDKIVDFELESKPIEYDPVVVTATLSEHLRSNVTVSADILTKSRMEELNGNTSGEIVESVGSMYAKSYDGMTGVNTPSIRGSQADQVLVLIDGLRLNTAQGGGVDLNNIPLAAMDRIEIIKGGHSALLGSDAIGGAINFITKDMLDSKGFHYGVNTTLGSFGTQIHTVNGIQRIGPMVLFATYNRTRSDGDFEYEAPKSNLMKKRQNNDTETDNIFLKGKVRINHLGDLQIVYHNLHTRKGAAGSVLVNTWDGSSQLTPNARSEVKRHTLRIESCNQLSNRLLLKEQIGYHVYDYHFVNPDWMTDDLHENTSVSALVQGIYSFNNQMIMNVGLNYQKDELASTKFTNVDSRIMTGLFGQIELRHNLVMTRWTWIPAIRWDGYSDVGASTSPKLGVMVTVGENANYTLKGNIGKSFRVPSLNDLYWPTEDYGAWGGVEGNPGLKPEYGNNYDIGFSYALFRNWLVQFETMYFYNHIEDLIAWTMDAMYWSRPFNVGKAIVRGVESSLKFRLPSEIAYIHVCYTTMKATDETPDSPNKGNRLVYRPDDKWDFLVGTKLGFIHANCIYRIVSQSFTTADNLASLDGYQVLNANIGAKLMYSGFTFTLKLQGMNLLDKKLYLVDGYPLPGREFRFTVGIEY